jgi:uncharacterized membrane protein
MTLLPLLSAPPIIQVHVICAILAVVMGPPALVRRSRDRWHRGLGQVWVAAMAGTAVTSFFINEARIVGPFSAIHVLSVITLAGLWQGVSAARAGRIAEHRVVMLRLYTFAVLTAGTFTLLPGRRMSESLFPAAPWAGFIAVSVVAALGIWLVWRAGVGPWWGRGKAGQSE